jgi:hypothetical protein
MGVACVANGLAEILSFKFSSNAHRSFS